MKLSEKKASELATLLREIKQNIRLDETFRKFPNIPEGIILQILSAVADELESAITLKKKSSGGKTSKPIEISDMSHDVAKAIVRIDGASRGNPGPAAAAAVLESVEGKVIGRLGRHLGKATNNWAEYNALIAGLDLAKRHGVGDLTVFSDSQLLVRQMTGEYQVKNADIKLLHNKASALADEFKSVNYIHVPRENNRAADKLANEVLDLGHDIF